MWHMATKNKFGKGVLASTFPLLMNSFDLPSYDFESMKVMEVALQERK